MRVDPGPRSAQRAAVRRRLVRGGRTVLAGSGFAGASVRDVAAAAGLNRATFYAHFDSKAELARAVCAEVVASAGPEWQRLDDVLVDGSQERLREWLASTVPWWERNADVLPALRETAAVDPDTGRMLGALFTALTDHLHRCTDGFDEARRRRVLLTTQLLVVQLDQVVFDHVVLGIGDVDLPELLDLLAEIWHAAVRSW